MESWCGNQAEIELGAEHSGNGAKERGLTLVPWTLELACLGSDPRATTSRCTMGPVASHASVFLFHGLL